MRARNKLTMTLGIALALAATACGSAARTSTKAPTPTAPTSAGTTLDASAATTEVTEDASTYRTKTFNLPFDVTVPTWAQRGTPDDEQPNFVTWQASDADRAVRFLIPVNVYPPGGTGTTPPPKDYLAYLLSQTDHGAHFADTTKTPVGGRPATIVTATVDSSLDGSLGCPAYDMAAADCFGLQPDLVLRLAVIDTGDNTLLVWLRNSIDNPTTEIESFENMLTSIQFSDRAVQAPAVTTTAPAIATALDGTYRWTITKDDALAHGLPSNKTPEALAFFPTIFTVTMDTGTWHLRHRDNGDFDDGGGTYTVDGDQIAFNWNGSLLTFSFTVDGDGTLHLDPQPTMNPGDQFIWATEPWTKIAGDTGSSSSEVAAGTYRWTITKDDALTYGPANDNTPENLATYPWVFTMTMKDGMTHLTQRDGDGDHDGGRGTYAVNGDQITFTWQNGSPTQTFTYTVDNDGTLHLVAVLPMSAGDQFVTVTEPWTKIG